MKNLIFLNGTMGVGKTATSHMLLKLLPQAVFLDGDWCWYADPFLVNEETKRLVIDNIGYVLHNFLTCAAYENVIFCWVMQEESIMEQVLSRLQNLDYHFYPFSLVCSEQALIARLQEDIDKGIREKDVLERALARLPNYWNMPTVKIDVNDLTPEQAAASIYKHIYPAEI